MTAPLLGLTSPALWYTTRAAGVVALVLLTASMVLGMLTATRAQSDALPRFAVSDLHRRISLLVMVFVVLHIATTALDSFVKIGWLPAVVPFVAGWKPLWVGLGAVAFDLLVAVMVTSLLRLRLSAGAWRGVHWLVYACWPVAVVHAITVGTDTSFAWLQVLLAVCVASVLGTLAWRLYAHPTRGGLRTAAPRRAAAPTSVRAVPAATRGRAVPAATRGRAPEPTGRRVR